VRRLGLYCGARNLNGFRDFENWLGSPVPHVEDFIDGSTWASIENPSWYYGWHDLGKQIEFSIPIIPQTGGSIQAGAHGDYDAHFVALARNLVSAGLGDITLRLGWEMNGSWFKWSAVTDPAAFAAYWVRIVNAMRSVAGQNFKFDWSPTLGKGNMTNVEAAYPGDAFVDYIGVDVYDQSWIPGYQNPDVRWQEMMQQPFGLQWHADFCATHHKLATFPEWGLCIRSDGHGGGDTPSFIRRMFHWIRTHPTAHADYFNYNAPDGRHALDGQFPNSEQAFKKLFGGF
jgi:hypothetical protein